MNFQSRLYNADFDLYLETYSPDPKKNEWIDDAVTDSILEAKFANDLKLEEKE
jgi:hypothetical protein